MPATNGASHNSGALNDDDLAALQLSFSAKIRAAQRDAGTAFAVYSAKRTAVNGLFSQARGVLNMTRKEFEEVLAAQDMDEDQFIEAEAKRTKRFALQGLPVGAQLDMFSSGARNDAADDQARAHANGYRAGKRGDERDMPESISPVFMNDWLGGYDQGQAELGAAFVRANEIEAAKNAKKPVLTEAPADEDDGEELTEAAIKAGAKKLKNSDFMKPGAEPEAAAA